MSELQRIVKSGGSQGDLLKALVEARKKNENEKNQKIIQASMKDDPRTIAQQFEEENNQATANEVARGVAGALAQKKKRADANMRKVMNRGLAAAPVRKPMMAAQGGIVGYANGNMVRDPRDMPPEEELSRAEKIARARKFSGLGKRMSSILYPAGKSGLAGKGEEAGKAAFKESLAPKNMPMAPQALPPTAMTAPKQGLAGLPVPPQAMPKTETTPVQATTKIEEVPKDDTAAMLKQEVKTETDPFRTKEYQDWFDVFVQTLSAKGGEYAKAYIDAKTKLSDRDKAAAQQVIDNENTKADLDIRREANQINERYRQDAMLGRTLTSYEKELNDIIEKIAPEEKMLYQQSALPDLEDDLSREQKKKPGLTNLYLGGVDAERVKELEKEIKEETDRVALQLKKQNSQLVARAVALQAIIAELQAKMGIPSINPAPAPAPAPATGQDLTGFTSKRIR